MMPLLNLPEYDAKIIRENGKLMIFDPFRQKYVALTPEEWVRQNFVNYLVEEKGYPKNLLGNEISLSLNSTTKRCDSIVYDSCLNPLMIIEYKAPSVTIKRTVFDQISRYNASLRVRFLTVSNGIRHYCCLIDYNNLSYTFLTAIPSYRELLDAPPFAGSLE